MLQLATLSTVVSVRLTNVQHCISGTQGAQAQGLTFLLCLASLRGHCVRIYAPQEPNWPAHKKILTNRGFNCKYSWRMQMSCSLVSPENVGELIASR